MSINANQLIKILNAKFEAAGGRISFRDFMEIALYDPVIGYYSVNIQSVGGRSADFSTWATTGNLGAAIANWITEELEHHQLTKRKYHLIEIGGGDGSLAKQIFSALNWRTRRRATYHIVDVSKPLREQQKKALQRFKNVQWHQDIDSALRASDHRALIFSNELVDAFPANWYCWDGQQWQEVMVQFDQQSGLAEVFEPAEGSVSDIQHQGQRIEKHLSYKNWLNSWAPQLAQGSILTIDYGHPDAKEIYKNKLNGTMRGYFKHQLISGGDIYKRIGKQDLTSDVNFTEIKLWGEQLGWYTTGLHDQYSFFKSRIPNLDFSGQEIDAAKQFYVLSQRVLS